MIKDPRQRFSKTSDRYDTFRPTYPPELIDWISTTTRLFPAAAVADIGCGTGISTRLFAERGYNVVGIDPNNDMLVFARRRGGVYRTAEADATGLDARSLDLVICGQSMHWFDLPNAFVEWRRILKDSGWAAAFWNIRARSEFLDEYDAVLKRFCREYGQIPAVQDVLDATRANPLVRSYVQEEFVNSQFLDRASFFGRVYSSSYAVQGVSDPAGFEEELARLFDSHQKNGRVEFAYRVPAAAWRISPVNIC